MKSPEAPTLDPGTQAFVDSLSGPPVYTVTPQAARAALVRAQQIPVDTPDASIEDITFPAGPTGAISIRIIRPPSADGPLPAVFHFHGGGWVLGDKDTHDRMSRELAVGAHAAIVFVDYDRAPEACYPVAIEQAYAAMLYVVEHAGLLGLDARRLAVVGDSSGGNIAAALTLMAKARGAPRLALQVLFYPVTDADFETRSYHTFAEGPWLERKAMQWFWDAYLPEIPARSQAWAAPLRASIDQLRGLPEAFIALDENDVLRDEGEAYARKLMRAGVRVTSVRYNGTIHDFVLLNALHKTPAARGAMAHACEALRAALHPALAPGQLRG